jgi:hypothetical protein
MGEQVIDIPANGVVTVYLLAGASDGDSRTTDITALDVAENPASVPIVVRRDMTPPQIELGSDVQDHFPGSRFALVGSCDDQSACELIVEGEHVKIDGSEIVTPSLAIPVDWVPGQAYAVAVEARDSPGNEIGVPVVLQVHVPCDGCSLIDGVRGLCSKCQGSGKRDRACENKNCKGGLSIDKCSDCGGRGRAACQMCEGSGSLAARACGGCNAGLLTCSECNGARKTLQRCRKCNGYGTVSKGVAGYVTCGNCNRTKKAMYGCVRCKETGTEDCGKCNDGYSKPECPECARGFLKSECPTCEGAKTLSSPCSICDSAGRVERDCSICRGSSHCNKCYGTGHADPSLIAARKKQRLNSPGTEGAARKEPNPETGGSTKVGRERQQSVDDDTSPVESGQVRESVGVEQATVAVSPQLLTNPSCEEHSRDDEIPGWESSPAGAWVRRSEGPKAQHGQFFFFPGANERAELTQTVALAEFRDSIKKGQAKVEFRGYLASWNRQDALQVQIEALSSSGKALAVSNSGDLHYAQRWELYAAALDLPPSTRSVKVRLISVRNEGKNNDGYFDNLSLTLISKQD